MLRKITALSALAVSLLAAGSARAEYFAVGAYEFRAVDPLVKVNYYGGRGAYVEQYGTAVVMATIHIPVGRTLRSVYCHMLDSSSTQDAIVRVLENSSTDTGSWGGREMLKMKTSGSAGHFRLVSSAFVGSKVIRDWSGTGPYTFYSYNLEVTLGDSTNLHIKNCLVETL
jgi:hypothetical protein